METEKGFRKLTKNSEVVNVANADELNIKSSHGFMSTTAGCGDGITPTIPEVSGMCVATNEEVDSISNGNIKLFRVALEEAVGACGLVPKQTEDDDEHNNALVEPSVLKDNGILEMNSEQGDNDKENGKVLANVVLDSSLEEYGDNSSTMETDLEEEYKETVPVNNVVAKTSSSSSSTEDDVATTKRE